MDDLISRQAVNDALDRLCNSVCPYSKKQRYAMCGACTLGGAFDVLCTIPSVQSEIIRCKDCLWYEIYQLKADGTDDRRYKPSYCMLHSERHKGDYYCADGERRGTQ